MTDTLLRLAIFTSLFIIFSGLEWQWPRRPLSQPKGRRWLINLGLGAAGMVLVRLLQPLSVVGVALHATSQGWGFMPLIPLPHIAQIFLGVLLLDVWIYGQHLAFHKVKWLWRLHRLHHADKNLDVSSAVRFHPLEILLSVFIKILAVVLWGIPPEAVLIFEIILSSSALFSHSNINLPQRLDRVLRWLVVTPDMHRIHHSILRIETDSNFGFNLSVWDRVFRTYTPHPQKGQRGMTIGLEDNTPPSSQPRQA